MNWIKYKIKLLSLYSPSLEKGIKGKVPGIDMSIFVFILFLFISIVSCKTSQKAASASGKQLSGRERLEFENTFFDADKEKILGNYDLAETDFLKALRIDPTSGAAMFELANIYTFQNNKKLALQYSKKAALADPNNIWYQLLYIESLKDNKMPAEVVAAYQKLLKKYPERVDFYYELANAYLYESKPAEALKVYDKIESLTGVTEDASMQKIKIYKAVNNSEKAVIEVQKLIKAFPKEGKYYGILGELYQDKGQNEKALQAYNDLLKADPENAFVHLSLADYYKKNKQNDKAFSEVKIAFKNKELDIDTKVKILLSYYTLTEFSSDLKADAEELCRILIEVHPDDAKSFSIYGDFLYRDKKFEDARTQYRKAVAIDKEKYALWNQLLIIDSELNDYYSLLKESKEAMELFPSQPLPYFFNGASNIQLKNYKEALTALIAGKEYVFDNKPVLTQFYSSIGDALNQLKNYPASDSAYNKALEVDSNNVYVLNNYAYYLSLRNVNLEKAEAMSKRSNQIVPNSSSYQDTYGWILYQMKKYDDAKVWIGKAIENGGSANGTLLEHYGDVLFKLGETEKSLKYWMDAKKASGTTDLIDKKIADKKLYE